MRLVSSLVLPRLESTGEIKGTEAIGKSKQWTTLRQELSLHSIVDGPVGLDFASPPQGTVVKHFNLQDKDVRRPKSVRKQHQIIVTLPKSTPSSSPLPLLAVESVEYDNSDIMSSTWIRADNNGWMRDCGKGEGGLLDALVSLRDRGEVRLTGRLMVMLVDGEVELQLTVNVELLDKIWSSWETTAKRIFVQHLFPSKNGTEVADPGLDEFYAALERAPATRGGLRVESDSRLDVEGDQDVVMRDEETTEEQITRERTAVKGKGKELLPFIDLDNASASTSISSALPSTSASSDIDEHSPPAHDDPILRPEGLRCELMPFQSRTVRWLLEREGKYVVTTVESRTRAVGGKRKASTSKLERAVELIEGDEAEDGESDDEVETVEEQVEELKELPLERLSHIRRGPMWERRIISDDSIAGATQDVWFNRFTLQLSIEDPAQHTVVTGSMLCEEMGLGKTCEVISLILLSWFSPFRRAVSVS